MDYLLLSSRLSLLGLLILMSGHFSREVVLSLVLPPDALPDADEMH